MRKEKGIPNPGKSIVKEMPVVLVVEDDVALNRLIQVHLEREGFRTESASNGKEAISILANQPDVLLLLDFILPDMNGKEFLEMLENKSYTVPFVIMTGFGDEKIAVEMMKLGARDYMVKDPNFIDILPQKIKKVFRELEKEKKLALANEELIKYREHLEELVKERTVELESFTYSVSHDLRAPLRAIDGFSKMLAEKCVDKLDENGKQFLSMIRSNARMMDQLINDLLTLSHLGRKEINLRRIDIKELVEMVFQEMVSVNPKPRLNMQENNVPLTYADRVMIKQVIVNLLSNAVKYSKYQKNPCVEVGYLTKGNENIYYVKDNGVGFEMQHADKLFGVFQRLHTQDEFEGTGVGLAIVKRIINRHGGRVWAEGKVGNGATFYFTLPIKRSH